MGRFWEWWSSLPVELRYGILATIYGGVALAFVSAAWKFSGRLALGSVRLLQRFLNWALPPREPPPLTGPEVRPDLRQPGETHAAANLTETPPPPPISLPAPAGPVDAATPAPAPEIPRPPVTGFVARRDTRGRDILKCLTEELAPAKRQLLALCGAGGVGKTTLAAEAVRALSDAFGRRVAWVSADGRPDFSLTTLLDEVAAQLGHPELRTLSLEQKDERLRALVAAAPTLVVLDNFETIAEAEQERCAGWLSHRADCSAVITARDEVPHAGPVNIYAMSVDEAREFVKRLVAQARHPHSFAGLDHDQIISAADRIPLVLQWIIKQIDRAKQPGTVLGELARGEGDAAKRVFGRSFGLLSDDARAALLALSLFVPGASRAVLAEVAGFGADAARLDAAAAQLAELWLADTTNGNERLTVAGLTRELAKHHLAADPRAAQFRHRFVAYFVNYARTHRQPTPEDFDALEAERENLLAAADTAFEGQQWREVVNIRYALEEFLDVRGYWDEAIKRGQQAVEVAYVEGDEQTTAVLMLNVAVIRQRRGEYDEARQAYDQSAAAFRKLGDERNFAATVHNQAVIAQAQGDKNEARRLYEESLEIERRLGNQGGVAISLHQLAILAQAQGDAGEARRLFGESLEIKRRLGDQIGVSYTLHQLGKLAQNEGGHEKARRLYEESLEISKRLGNQDGIAISLWSLGLLTGQQGDRAEAVQLLGEALTILEKLGSPNAGEVRQVLERLKDSES
jgi:tetratricopeptide (TPR) repeat protein